MPLEPPGTRIGAENAGATNKHTRVRMEVAGKIMVAETNYWLKENRI
jgi:hypothetical protein